MEPTNPPAATLPVAAPLMPGFPELIRFENEKKSAGVGLSLCWILGIFGVHRFYLKKEHAVTMLVITLVSLPLCLVIVGFAGLVATWVWMIIDLFFVCGWARQYNISLLTRIQARLP